MLTDLATRPSALDTTAVLPCWSLPVLMVRYGRRALHRVELPEVVVADGDAGGAGGQ
jgi:hypothetical protein